MDLGGGGGSKAACKHVSLGEGWGCDVHFQERLPCGGVIVFLAWNMEDTRSIQNWCAWWMQAPLPAFGIGPDNFPELIPIFVTSF